MPPTTAPNITPNVTAPIIPGTCPVCHQPTKPEWYFCPNCGTLLHTPPLSISLFTQIKLYAFSIILPMMGFLFVTRWQGNKYFKSEDEKRSQIGLIAWGLLILSTIITVWVAVKWAESYTQETVQGINDDMSNYGSE
jgi:hypothetical protein